MQQNNYELELHVFCEGSEKAYSAVAYLQTKKQEGETTMSLVASKSIQKINKKINNNAASGAHGKP